MNLKLTKTAIRELTRLYRGVLVAAFIASALVANGANAAINVQTGTTDISGDVITTVVANAKLDEAAEAPEVDNPADHYGDYSFKDKTGATVDGSNLATTTSATYQGIASTADGAVVARSTTLGYDSGTLVETDYQYKDGQGNWTTFGSGEKTFTDTYQLGQYAGYEVLDLTGVDGGYTYALDGTKYQFGVGPTQYTLSEDGTKVVNPDSSETLITDLPDGDLKTAALAAQAEYNGAKTAIQAKQDVIDGYAHTEALNYAAAGTTLGNDQTIVDNLEIYEQSFEAAKDAYDTAAEAYGDWLAYKDYNNSLSQAIDTKADGRIDKALEAGGAIKAAIDAYDNTESGLTAETKQEAIDEIAGNIAVAENSDGYNVIEAGSDAAGNLVLLDEAIGHANTAGADEPSNASGVYLAIEEAVAFDNTVTGFEADTLQGAIDEMWTVANETFAEKEEWVGNTLGIDTTDSTPVQSAYAAANDGEGTNYLSEATTFTGADIALDKAIYDNATFTEDDVANSNGNYGAGSVKEAIASIDSAIGDKSELLTEEQETIVGAINEVVGNITVPEATGDIEYAYISEGADVAGNLVALDGQLKANTDTLGNIAGVSGTYLASTSSSSSTSSSTSTPATVAQHLQALNDNVSAVIGTTEDGEYVQASNTIGANLNALDKQVSANTTAIGTTTDGTYVAAANTVGQNLNALDSALGDVRSDMASTQASNERRFAQIDRRIDKLEDKMEKGLAANNALAGLVPLDHTHTTQISAAMGGYGSSQALAIGAFHYLNDRTLLNAGVGYGGNSNMSYKVGVTFGF